MVQSMIRTMRGYVKIRVEGYSPERFLNLCSHHQIYIWGLTPCDHAYEMYMELKGFRRLRPIVRKTHTKVVLTERFGLPFFLRQYRKRVFFLVGPILCAGLLFFYSSLIWDIHFVGNEKWTDEILLEFLQEKQIVPCMRKDRVNCAQIVKDIRQEYNDIVWVSASIDGSLLKIQVKENEDTFINEETETEVAEQQNGGQSGPTVQSQKSDGQDQALSAAGMAGILLQENGQADTGTLVENPEDEHPCDLIASKDGVITKIITRAGTPLVHEGDTVVKGQVLVSGRVEVKNDAAEVIGYHYREADADIFADTQMNYSDETDIGYQKKIYEESRKSLFYVTIRNRRYSVGSLKNDYKNWEKHTLERGLKMGENFYLPIAVGMETIKSYYFKKQMYTNEELQEQLSERFQQFSNQLQEKGIQIIENSVKIHVDKKSAVASGMLYLNERITEKADTEIIAIERNEQDESGRTDD